MLSRTEFLSDVSNCPSLLLPFNLALLASSWSLFSAFRNCHTDFRRLAHALVQIESVLVFHRVSRRVVFAGAEITDMTNYQKSLETWRATDPHSLVLLYSFSLMNAIAFARAASEAFWKHAANYRM
jgi:hypothetical protein